MDPLATFSNIPIITDLFLLHLTGTELIRVSEASPLYHDLIFNSSKCLLKIKRNINSGNIDSLPEHRKYLNVSISRAIDEKRIQRPGPWKSLELREMTVNLTMLRHYERSCTDVEQLSFRSVDIEYPIYIKCSPSKVPTMIVPRLWFKTVKKLMIHDAPGILAYDLIIACPSLSNLSLTNVDVTNRILATLTDSDLRLREFCLSEYSEYNFCHDKAELASFLQSQLDNIEHLQLDIWTGIPALKVIFKMPNLKHLELYQLDKSDITTNWDAVDLDLNNSLRHLIAQDLRNNAKLLTKLLTAAPKLQELRVHEFTREIAEAIESSCKNLVILEADFNDQDYLP